MTRTMAEGTFFERYKPYFRFSQQEMDERRNGMLFDKLPGRSGRSPSRSSPSAGSCS